MYSSYSAFDCISWNRVIAYYSFTELYQVKWVKIVMSAYERFSLFSLYRCCCLFVCFFVFFFSFLKQEIHFEFLSYGGSWNRATLGSVNLFKIIRGICRVWENAQTSSGWASSGWGTKIFTQYFTDAKASIPSVVLHVTGTSVGAWCVNTLAYRFIAVIQVLYALINICYYTKSSKTLCSVIIFSPLYRWRGNVHYFFLASPRTQKGNFQFSGYLTL